ncbi:MAG: DUF975 family protein [Bacillota bacterium]|nr:DUF975 family protein [Bacillota bacterium]
MQENMMGQNIIITEPSSKLRELGRNALKGKWQLAILALVVFELCFNVPVIILNALFGVKPDFYGFNSDYNVDVYSDMYNSMPSYSFLSSVYIILVAGAFTLGITIIFLAIFRRQQAGVADVFLGFEHFGKAMGLMLFQGLFIFLWMLLFIVPGIIASIRYSQAFYILADDPSKSIRQCMNESKKMMKGNKAKYFCLLLSFIGWLFLSVLPASILEAIPAITYAPEVVQAIVILIGNLFVVPVTAYIYSASTGFYEILAGHLIKETEPAPIDPEAIPAIAVPEEVVETPEETVEEVAETPEEAAKTNEEAPKVEEKLSPMEVARILKELDDNK